MASQKNSHFGTNGYEELYYKRELARGSKNSYSCPIHEKREKKQKELYQIKAQENKRKTSSPRSSKTLMPNATGRQQFRPPR